MFDISISDVIKHITLKVGVLVLLVLLVLAVSAIPVF